MLAFGPLAFLQPWVLLVLATLPALWYLLRLTPPPPQRTEFPPLRLLHGLTSRAETPRHTPLWLLLLRLLIAALLILAFAGPLLHPMTRLNGAGPLVLVLDNGWAAAPQWHRREAALSTLLDQAERSGRPVLLLPTAPVTAGAENMPSLLSVAEARRQVGNLAPQPWPVDRAALADRFARHELPDGADVVWLSDGIEDGAAGRLAVELARAGPVRLFEDDPFRTARALLPPAPDGRMLAATVLRPRAGAAETVAVHALGEGGLILARTEARFAPDARRAEARFELPVEARNRVLRLQLAGAGSAGGVVLLDARWNRRVVGIISSAGSRPAQPLLTGRYYLERALGPHAELRADRLDALLARPPSVLILPGEEPLPAPMRPHLARWLAEGGVLVRFAGPHLAGASDPATMAQPSAKDDALLPVTLRPGDRTLGGALSWEEPARLGPFPEQSPFFGLPVPADVVVHRQVLAQPGPDLTGKVWAQLADGTPLVTAARRGDGWVVLFHVPASSEWSTLPLSGVFVGMLERIIDLGQGTTGMADDMAATTRLHPVTTLDGFGRLVSPPASAQPLTRAALDTAPAGLRHPPGLYAPGGRNTPIEAQGLHARNLLGQDAALVPIGELPAGVARSAFVARPEVSLMPYLLAAALALLIADGLAALALQRGPAWRRRIARQRSVPVVAILILGTGMMPAAWAAEGPDSDAKTEAALLDTRLGYVATGSAEIDAMSQAGLNELSNILTIRTAFEPAPPFAVDVERDVLVPYPLLYWPMTPDQPTPSAQALAKIGAYLEGGGMILFDTRDADLAVTGISGMESIGPGTAALRRILGALDAPPLVPVPKDHVLTRAFYLLQSFPGRHNGEIWIEAPSDGGVAPDVGGDDGVASIVIGGNDWAAAWAADERGRPLATLTPGNNVWQRELAFRFGINLVMYALTGNYKADQVHVPALLERLGN